METSNAPAASQAQDSEIRTEEMNRLKTITATLLISLTLLRLMTVTDPRVVREHWRGGGDVVELIGATALIAARLLPKKIRRVLTSRVEAPKAPSKQSETMAVPLLVEQELTTKAPS